MYDDNDSGATESHNIQTLNEAAWNTSTLDSGMFLCLLILNFSL